jgi:hypothetical protein
MKSKWYENQFIVIALLFLFFPVGLYGLWKGSIFSRNTKIILTVLFIGLIMTASFQKRNRHISHPASSAEEVRKSSTSTHQP